MSTNLKIDKNPVIIDRIKDNFVEDGEYSRQIMTDEFKFLMFNHPEDICVIVGYNESNEITGHLIAFKPYNRNYIVLDQVYNSVMDGSSELALDVLKYWTKAKGLKEIRFETERDSVALKAAEHYGFKEMGVSMRMELK